MFKAITQNFDFRFYLRFASLFLLLFCCYTFVHAVSVPSGTYYPFVAEYLNFPVLVRISVLHTSQLFLQLLGYPTTITGARILTLNGFTGLEMAWACYGMGVKSFWIAFICAHSISLRQKLRWCLLGVVSIFLLNCIRVTTMFIAKVDDWSIANYLGTNAHDLFNYLCYAALFGLVLLFYARVKTEGTHQIRPKVSSTATPASTSL